MRSRPTCRTVSDSISGTPSMNSSTASGVPTAVRPQVAAGQVAEARPVGGVGRHLHRDVAPAPQGLGVDEAHVYLQGAGGQLLAHVLHDLPLGALLAVQLVLEDAVQDVGARVAAQRGLLAEERAVDILNPHLVHDQM